MDEPLGWIFWPKYGPDIPASDNPARSGPDNLSWSFFAQENWIEFGLVFMERDVL
jgi:hypothetical protein